MAENAETDGIEAVGAGIDVDAGDGRDRGGRPGDFHPRRPLPGLATASLVIGIIGVLLSNIPLIGRTPAVVLGLVAAGLGVAAVLRNPPLVPRSRRGIAVAGLTLGIVSTVDGLIGFSIAAIPGALTSLIAGW